jgi:uncharacterized membrane protein
MRQAKVLPNQGKRWEKPITALGLTVLRPKMKCNADSLASLGGNGMYRGFAGALGAFLLLANFASPARADLKLCNNTDSLVNVAIGYKDKEGWATEGWWTAEPQKCLNLLKGTLPARYYYVLAVDRSKGGAWGGKSLMCVRNKIFTIRGFDKCEDRGYEKAGFFEVDTGEESDWTISLSGEKTTQGTP